MLPSPFGRVYVYTHRNNPHITVYTIHYTRDKNNLGQKTKDCNKKTNTLILDFSSNQPAREEARRGVPRCSRASLGGCTYTRTETALAPLPHIVPEASWLFCVLIGWLVGLLIGWLVGWRVDGWLSLFIGCRVCFDRVRWSVVLRIGVLDFHLSRQCSVASIDLLLYS